MQTLGAPDVSRLKVIPSIQSMDHACERCDEAACCAGDCSSGHCISVGVALPAIFSFPLNIQAASGFVKTDDGLITQRPAYLFRPPRG